MTRGLLTKSAKTAGPRAHTADVHKSSLYTLSGSQFMTVAVKTICR